MNAEITIVNAMGSRVWGSIFPVEVEEELWKETFRIQLDQDMHVEEGETLEITFMDKL